MDSSSNKTNKNNKKINKIKLRLTEKYKINFSSKSTSIIIISNAGLGNAVKRYELETALFAVSDYILDILTPPKEPFAIVFSKDIRSSEIIMDKMEEFTIGTPDLVKRPSVKAFCLYADNVSDDIINSVGNYNCTLPQGLEITNDFIDATEEEELLDYFVTLHKNDINQIKKRTVLHFGYEFNYSNNRVDVTMPLCERPIPDNCKRILHRLEQQKQKSYTQFDQLTVNIYQPGDGIPPHVDTHSAFSDEIISVSLGSDIVMEWFNPQTEVATNVDLKARSVCIMRGESRYLWQHSIAARKSDLILISQIDSKNLTRRQRGLRVSLTFRKVNSEPHCACSWPQCCDIKRGEPENCVVSSDSRASQLEQEFVHKVYDEIAGHFSSTRHSMWPKVREFIVSQPQGSVGADIGCGNGKYFPAMAERGLLLASDMSFNLCKIASKSHGGVVQSNCLQLPFKESCCDYFISIAVLHHLSTPERRQEALTKMVALLCRGGRGLVYVWAKEQKKSGVKSHYINNGTRQQMNQPIVTECSLPVHVNRTEFSSSDMLVPWCKKGDGSSSRVFTRYYHLFIEGELESICLELGNVTVVKSWYDSGNWAVVIEKL